MSHTSKIRSIKFRDIAALHAAVAELKAQGVNCDLRQNAAPRAFSSGQIKVCPYMLHLGDSPYDVGFEADAEEPGTFNPVFDDWKGYVRQQIGAANAPAMFGHDTSEEGLMTSIGKLAQLYGKHAAIHAATAQGYMVEGCSTDDQGNIHLTIAEG